MQSIVAINITKSGMLLNKNSVPILFYCNSSKDIKEVILENEEFQNYLNREVFTFDNYSDSLISYSFYNIIDGEDSYEENSIEIEDWKSLKELPELVNEYIKRVIDKIINKTGIIISLTGDFENDILNVYLEIDKKYPGKFSKLTYKYYIEHELLKYNLKDHNYKFLISKLNIK